MDIQYAGFPTAARQESYSDDNGYEINYCKTTTLGFFGNTQTNTHEQAHLKM